MPTEIDSLSISIEAKATKANDAIDRLVGKLDRLSISMGRMNTSNLNGLANGVDRLGRAMQTMNAVKTADFTRLATNLAKLGTINVSALNSMASSLSHLTRAFNTLGAVSTNAQQVGTLAQNLSRLGSASMQRAITNIPQLAVALNNLMTTLSRSPRVSQNVIQMTNALANLASQGSRMGTASNSIERGLNRASTSAQRAKKSFGGLASVFGKFYATYFPLIRAFKGLGKAINRTADYVEAFNYFTVSMGKIASKWDEDWENYGDENARNYSNKFFTTLDNTFSKLSGVSFNPETGLLSETGLKNLGLNLQEVTQYAAQLASMMDAVGQSGEVTLATTNAFVKLAGDISSLYNIDYSKAAERIRSVLQGQSRAGYGFGWDTTMAALQATADRLDLSKPVSEMAQWEKQQLRILTILEQSRVAYGDQSNTINTLANQMRIFKNNISEVGMVLGQLFVPILTKLMPIINGVTIAIKRLMANIAGFLGIKIEDTGQGFTDMGDDIDGVTDSLEDATAAAKKLKTTTLGIDELNINAPQDASGSGSGVGGGGIDLTDEIIAATEEYEKVWNAAYAQMENRAQVFADKISGFFTKIWKAIEPVRNSISNLWNNGLKDFSNFQMGTLEDFYTKFLKPIGKWAIGEGLPRFFDITNKLYKNIKWDRLKKSLKDFYGQIESFATFTFEGVLDFYEYFLVPIASWTVGKALPQLLDIVTDFAERIDWGKLNTGFEKLFKVLSKATKAIGQGFINFFETISDIVSPVIATTINLIADAVGVLSDALLLIDPDALNLVGGALGGMLGAFALYKGVPAILTTLGGAFTTFFTSLSTGIGTFLSNPALLAAGGIGAIAGYLSTLFKTMEEANKAEYEAYQQDTFGGKVTDIVDQIREQTSAIKERSEALLDYQSNAGLGEIELAKDLAEKYYDLYEKSNLTNEERLLMKQYAEDLVGILPDLAEHINNETGLLELQKDALWDLIEAQEYYYLAKAAEESLIGLYAERINAERDLDDATELANRIYEERVRVSEELAEAENELANSTENLYTDNLELENRIAELDKELYNLETAWGLANTAVEEAQSTYNLVQEDIDYMTGVLYENRLEAQESQNQYEQMADSYVGATERMKAGGIGFRTQSEMDALAIAKSQQSVSKSTEDLAADTETYTGNMTTAWGGGTTSILESVGKITSGLHSSFSSSFESTLQSTSDFVSKMKQKLEELGFGGAVTGAVIGGISFVNHQIPAYADGGFPEDGLFFANHTELVGGFGNGRTAVANNDMIVSGIKQGVKEAVGEILAPYLAEIERNTRETANKDLSVNIGDRDIARANARGQRSMGYTLIT